MMKYSRRNFLQMSAGALLASEFAAFGADAKPRTRAKFAPLKVKEIRIEAGASKPFTAMQVSDTHLTLVNAAEKDARKVNLAMSRHTIFPWSEHYFDEAVHLARSKGDLLLHTGDMIDFVSQANLAYTERAFASDDWYASSGNHEFSKYVGEAKEDAAYKADSYDRVQAAFPNDLTFCSRVVNGINFVAIDDVYYNVTESQHELFRKEVEKGLPIILMCHVPFYLPGLCADQQRGNVANCAYVTGAPLEITSKYNPSRAEQQKTDGPTGAFVAWLKDQKLLKGILCGHLHKFHEERFSATAMQYVCSATYRGEVQRVTFV